MSGAPPHRVVIDPNVFISATITPKGALGPFLGLIDDGTLVPVVTQHLVDEVVDVLGRPKLSKYVKPGAGAAFEEQMRRLGEWHADIVDLPPVTRDPRTTTSSHSHSALARRPSRAATTTYTRLRTWVSESWPHANS